MERWEYQTLVIDVRGALTISPASAEATNEQLVALGDEGWEMVGMQPIVDPDRGTHTMFCVFKRPKEQERPGSKWAAY